MKTLANVAEDVVQDVRARREPEIQMQATKEDLWDIVQQYEEALTMPDVPRTYLRDFFGRLKQRIEVRELTVAAVSDVNRELHQLANSAADTIAYVTEQIADLQLKNADLHNRLREAIAQNAVEFDSGMHEVLWIWAEMLAQQEGIEAHEAYAEIVREVERVRAQQEIDAA